MRYHEIMPIEEDATSSPAITAISAALARSEADVAAGRVVEGAVVLAKLRSMVTAYKARHNGEAVKRSTD